VGLAYPVVLLSPFVTGLAIAGSPRAKGFVARHFATCAVVGWTAFALVLPATVALDGRSHVAALAILCPLTALTWWRQDDGPDDGGGGDPDPLPEAPDIDWDRFERDLEHYRTSPPRQTEPV
jgi:hypothetical protein